MTEGGRRVENKREKLREENGRARRENPLSLSRIHIYIYREPRRQKVKHARAGAQVVPSEAAPRGGGAKYAPEEGSASRQRALSFSLFSLIRETTPLQVRGLAENAI